MKNELYELLETTFPAQRDQYNALMEDRKELDKVLEDGAKKARDIAVPIMRKVRKAVGVTGALSIQ